jgi:hypothetical protein
MRTSSRRMVSFLAAAALIVPSTLGVGTVTSAQASPLCHLTGTCDDADDSDSGSGSGSGSDSGQSPAKSVSPGVPTSPSEPSSPGPTDDPTKDPKDEPSEPGDPSDEPTEEPTDNSDGSGGLDVDDPDDSDDSDEKSDEELNGKFPKDAQLDENAPVFTEHPAAMGSESLGFKGLKGISFASVPTASGKDVVTLKIQAEEISIEGFSLSVRPPGEDHGLLTTADTMTLKGDVTVYIGSITATTKDGESLTLGPETPPPMDDVEPGLLRVTMGLVGSTADSIEYSNTDQRLKHA